MGPVVWRSQLRACDAIAVSKGRTAGKQCLFS